MVAPPLVFVAVPEGKTVKNRLHLDLSVRIWQHYKLILYPNGLYYQFPEPLE